MGMERDVFPVVRFEAVYRPERDHEQEEEEISILFLYCEPPRTFTSPLPFVDGFEHWAW